VADACAAGTCKGFAVSCDCTEDLDCLPLEDDDLCNGTLVCDTSEVPFQCKLDPASIIQCPPLAGPEAACAKSVCEPATGACLVQPANEGNACDDGSVCTLSDTCAGGTCVPGTALPCDDANVCTTDSCDPVEGCKHAAAEGPCDDLNECTTGDACAGGACVGTGSTECDDGNPCTKDVCLPGGGCQHVPVAVACNDGNACTLNDACVDGACVPGPTLECDDGNVCTNDACSGSGVCTHQPNAAACDDLNACTAGDACEDGACAPGKPVDCDDGNLCTTDACNPALGCTHSTNAFPCNDGNACTLSDACSKGACVGGQPPDCNDANPCTTDSCDPAKGCLHAANTLACDDSNACTPTDTCSGGACKGAGTADCDDGNPCTSDSCDPQAGCKHTPNSAPCSDGSVCTLDDVCSGGKCASGKQLPCDDGNVCTLDGCDPATACTHVAVEGACDDGNACTAGDACVKGVCIGLDPVSCDDSNLCTDDSCLPASGCQHLDNTLPCNDADACTLVDGCSKGSCVGTGTLSCDDGNVCTTDSCDPKLGCTHTPADGPCDDKNACTPTDVCVAGQCVGQGAVGCSDGVVCTADSCDPATGCKHAPIAPCCSNSVVEPPETCDDGNVTPGDGCDASCKNEVYSSCRVLHEKLPQLPSGIYTVDTDGAGPAAPLSVQCDMTADGGGWTLVAVARYGQHGKAGWNDNADLNAGSSTSLTDHWHFSMDKVNALAELDQFRMSCFESSNNFVRYWWGMPTYDWTVAHAAAESWDTYQKNGTSYPTSWAPWHYGLMSGNTETNAMISSHSGNHWACGGATAPGGEGYTGRGGVSSFRLWAK
jgi:cysteine-rich repeat protein